MIVLAKYKLLQKLIGLAPLHGLVNVILRSMYLTKFTSLIFLTSVYFILNIHDDVYGAMATVTGISGTLSVLATYSHLLMSRERFSSLLEKLREVTEERAKKVENEAIYSRAELRISFVTNIFLRTSFAIPTFAMSPFLKAAYHWCSGNYTVDSWFLHFPVWTPFELNTTSRWALMVLYMALVMLGCVLVFCTVPSLLTGLAIYLEAFVLDIGSIFVKVDLLANRQMYEKSHELEMVMVEHCKEAVDFHRKVNRLIDNLADVMNFIVLVTISLWALCICTALFLIEKYSGSNFIYDMQMPVLASVLPLIQLAVLFYLGQKFNTISMSLCDIIYQSEWYHYPRSVRRFLLIMLMRSQRPFCVRAYGIMELNLENFVRLLRLMYSAYMVLCSMD